MEEAGAGSIAKLQQVFQAEAASAAMVTPYIAKIDPETMTVEGTVEFPMTTTLNYLSNLLIHENGKIYTISGATLYEVDADTMEVKRSLALPTYDTRPEGTTYNGLVVAGKTTDIITKATSLIDQTAPSILVAVNTEDMNVRFQTDAPIRATRLGLAVQDGTQYVYASDNMQTQRFAIGESSFERDEAWSKAYRADGDGSTAAVSMVYMNDQHTVLFANNNSVIFGVAAPLQLFTHSAANVDATAFSTNATSVTTAGGSFYSAAADPYNTQMVVANDQINSVMAGWKMEDNGTLTKVWESDSYHTYGGTAIASDQEQIYLDDLRCDDSGANCEMYLVILDIHTGDLIADVKVGGSSPTIGQIFLGKDSAYLIASESGMPNGFVTRVTVK